MATSKQTDLGYAVGSDGIYDLVVDPAVRDLTTTEGLDAAIFVSLFSDRRARADEVADPMKRRGWIGDLVSDIADDRHGSGLWLYEQRRLRPEDVAGVRMEAEAALRWMIPELAKSVTAAVVTDSVARKVSLKITIEVAGGGITSRSYVLADATRTGLLARI